jgi:hypothetical protein
MYDKDYINKVDFHNFDMAKPPGRTYKYYSGKPLYAFGSGLSYSDFQVKCAAGAAATDDTALSSGASAPTSSATAATTAIKCSVAIGGGATAGEEVLMVYHSVGESIRNATVAKHPVPLKQLVAFERVGVTTTTPASVQFVIGPNQLGLVDADGDRQLIKGQHSIEVSNGAGFSQKFVIAVAESKVLATVPRMPDRGE